MNANNRKSWIFPNDLNSDKLTDKTTISWLITEGGNSELIEVGDLVYLFAFKINDRSSSGIYGLAKVTESPANWPWKWKGRQQVLTTEDPPTWAYDPPNKYEEAIKRQHQKLRVGLQIEKVFLQKDIIDINRLGDDLLLDDLEKSLWSKSHYLLSGPQETILKAVLEKELETGQGYEEDPFLKKIIELHAVRMAETDYIKRGFVVKDTGATESYDLACIKDGIERRVEVKGTRTKGTTVTLTRGEIEHVRLQITPVDLVVVSEIVVETSSDGSKASGGNYRNIKNWIPADNDLTIKTYDYKIPESL